MDAVGVAETARHQDQPARAVRTRPLARPLVTGILAAGGLLAFYLGVISLVQDWPHALQQLAEDRWFVAAIAAGFGTQVGLFTHLRGLHARMSAGGSAGGLAASTGTGTAAMLACCAHHLADVLPLLGASGAAIFLNAYKTPLLGLGIAMNLAGVAYLVWQIRRGSACTPNHPVEQLTLPLGMVAQDAPGPTLPGEETGGPE
ncbi:MAG: hypothetical protein HYY05_05845 [Chloroflexi bacterium]|nr:hypothetical protein [Chloroflexota bacterium]